MLGGRIERDEHKRNCMLRRKLRQDDAASGAYRVRVIQHSSRWSHVSPKTHFSKRNWT